MKQFLILFFLLLLSSCQSAKDALTLKKKASGDEFLVEKKSPLVLPPDYGKLPIPSESDQKKGSEDDDDIKISLGKDKLKINETIKNSKPTSIEESVLKKIK